MCYAQEPPAPPEKPTPLDSLRDLVREVRTALTSLAMLVIVAGLAASLNLPPVTGDCGDHGGRMAESEAASGGGVPASSPLAWANLVGRDGIEPPTLRFSAARSTD